MHALKRLCAAGTIGIVSLLLSGCLLFSLSLKGCVDPETGDGMIESRIEIRECETYSGEKGQLNVFCVNSINMGMREGVTSTIGDGYSFESFLQIFGSTGNVFLDPVVIQFPDNVSAFSATLSGMTMFNAVVQAGLSCIDTSPGEELCAEAGHQLVIFDLPPGAPLGSYDVEILFNVQPPQAIEIKPLVTGKVSAGGKTYYPLVVPCVTDLADAPALTIPTSEVGPVLLELPDLSNVTGCEGALIFQGGQTQAPVLGATGLAVLVFAVVGMAILRLRRSE